MNRLLRQLAIATGILALVGIVWPTLAQFRGEGRAANFKFRELYEIADRALSISNRTRTFGVGAEGIHLSNDLYRLISTRLENYAPGGTFTNLVAMAPECFYDASSRLVSSTGRLDLFALQQRFTLRGNEGFLFYLTNSTLIVSGHVRTYIHPELLRPSSR
jgi:hypothetical protein